MSISGHLEGRLHPFGVIVIGWQWVKYALYGGAISGLASGNLGIVLPIVGIGALIAAPFAYLAWKRFRYRVEGDRLVVERGVFVEQERVVPLDRIRGVDISAPLLHRALGVVRVSVDAAAAGGGDSELTLAAVTRAQAETLRHQVLQASPGHAVAEGQPTREAPTIARVTYRTLAIAGATSTRWLLAPLVALGALSNIVFRDESAVRRTAERGTELVPDSAIAIGVIAILVVIAAVAVAVIGSVLVDGDFRLTRDGDRLTAERGLLRRRSVSIDRGRISALEFGDTPLWRAVGLVNLRALVAGVGSGDGEARGRTNLLPAADPSTSWRLAKSIDRRATTELNAHPPAARSRRLVRAVVVPALATVVALAALEWVAAGVLLAATLIAIPLGRDRYSSLGHSVVNGRLAMRGGSLSRRHTVIDPATVASYRISSSPFQRRVGLCTLTASMGRGAGSRSALDIGHRQAVAVLAATEPKLLSDFTTSSNRVSRQA